MRSFISATGAFALGGTACSGYQAGSRWTRPTASFRKPDRDGSGGRPAGIWDGWPGNRRNSPCSWRRGGSGALRPGRRGAAFALREQTADSLEEYLASARPVSPATDCRPAVPAVAGGFQADERRTGRGMIAARSLTRPSAGAAGTPTAGGATPPISRRPSIGRVIPR